MMKRRITAAVCALVVSVTVFGCGTNKENDESIGFPQPGGENKAEQPLELPDTSENNDESNEVKQEEPETEEPAKKEPKQEEPAKEEPKKEEPKKEEPKAEETEKATIPTPVPAVNTTGDWRLLLVNPWYSLPEDFDVDLTSLKNNHYVDSRAYPDLQEMMDDMRAEGLSPYICSSYRTLEKQQTLYKRQINQYLGRGYSQDDAVVEASRWVAVPGTSEHHTGLALDIVAADYTVLDETQENTDEQKWLLANSYKYGFILRYPNGKTDITGIYYEPWHYRYVGKEYAKEIFESGLTLEEYLQTR